VDTLHRFMNGDENSAQDAKTMLDACNNLMTEFNCSALLVHHTGVSEESQHRARGSSAWRGALDIEISIVPGKDDQPIEIVQRKSKDAELSKDLFARLQSVEIQNWIDEDGEQVTSAVVVASDAPNKPNKKESTYIKLKKTLERAWFETGCDISDEKPYITKSALFNFLVTNDGLPESTANQYVKPSAKGKLINELLNAEIIKSHDNGWVFINDVDISSLMMRKKNE
jgi:hypothetical protein